MTYTLFQATLDLARLVSPMHEGTATGGSTATLVDTARVEPADYWNGGTLFTGSGNNANKALEVLDFASGTVTLATQASAWAAGNSYGIATADYPLATLRQAIKTALRSIGNIPARDSTLVTVSDQAEYTLPTGVYDVRRVEVAQDTAEPYDWQVHYHWQEISGKVRFLPMHIPQTTGYKIRLTYVIPHSEPSTDAATISDYIKPERLLWEGAVWCYRNRMQRGRGEEGWMNNLLNEALTRAASLAQLYPVPAVRRDPTLPW